MTSSSYRCTRHSALADRVARRAVWSERCCDDPPDPDRDVRLTAWDQAGCDGWTLRAIVRLHFLLLDDCARLADPATPLEDKFELLRWIYTEPGRDARPFSFAACLRLFGKATQPGAGGLDVREIRAAMRPYVSRWLDESFARYPAWMRALFEANPERFARRLEKDPQALNKTVCRSRRYGDLFGEDDFDSHDSQEAP